MSATPTSMVYGVGIIQQANVVRAVAELAVLDDYLASSLPFDSVEMFAPDGTRVALIPSPRLAGENFPSQLGISRPAVQRVLSDRAKALGTVIRLGVTTDSIAVRKPEARKAARKKRSKRSLDAEPMAASFVIPIVADQCV